MGAKDEKAQKYSEEEIEQAKKEAPGALSKAIKELFDDEGNGGIFYAHIIQQMCRNFDDQRIPTAAVSVTDKINLYVNSTFWVYELKTPQQRAAVLKHEILHLIFHHCYRCADFGNQMLANIAADLVVNSQIDPKIFGDFSSRYIFPENFGLPHDESLPFYYENFPVEDNPVCQDPEGHDQQHQQGQGSQQGQDQGQGDQEEGDGSGGSQEGEGEGDQSSNQDGGGGSGQEDQQESGSGKGDSNGQQGSQSGNSQGSGGQHNHDHAIDEDGKCKVCGGLRTVDYHGIWGEDEKDKISESMKRSLVNDAINRASDAAEKTAGNLPSAVQQAIELAKKKPQIPWQHVLRTFVSKCMSGVLQHTKKRMSKRYGTRPGTRIRQKLKFLLPMDVSGSISDKEYEIFLNEALAILKNNGVGAVDVLEWDAGITSTDKKGNPGPYNLTKDYKVTRTGRGGTNPDPAIEWINEHKSQYDGVVFFTDGYFFSELANKIKVPCIWVVTNGGTDEFLKGKYRVIKLPKVESDAA